MVSIEKIKGLLELMRIPHLFFSVPIGIAATFLASKGAPDIRIISLVAITVGLNHAAAHIMNDFFDRIEDSKNPRNKQRPIPSCRVKPHEALIFASVLFISALLFAYLLNILCFLIALLAAVIALLYSNNLKKKNIWGNISCGFVVALPVLFGWVAIGEPTLITYILFLIVFIWELGHSVLAAASDYTSDKCSNINTLPVMLGLNKTSIIVFLCYSSIIPIIFTIKPDVPAVSFLFLVILSLVLAFHGMQFLLKSSESNAKSIFIQSSLFLPFLAIILSLS